MKTSQTVEIVPVFGGGYYIGVFATPRAAQEFAASMLLAEAR